ncbi:MAG: serine/threonine protein kinase [Phycisphaerae bacterium]|nr:serine/threonine protein kinase [Phycisphaerae bacterium]
MSISQTLEVPGYQVVQYLGNGARSTIWQIRDNQSNERFVLKRVVKRTMADMRFIDQAVNEFEVASRLDHDNIRRVISIRKVKHWLAVREVHLIMEFCEGATIQDDPPRDILQVAEIFCQVASAMAYMNSRGFVHADMKPNNVVVAPSGLAKVIDLGQSCPLGTTKQRIQGTPDFIAPEQVHRGPLDARTDVFNFGATLYWALTGKPIVTALPKKGMLMVDMIVQQPQELNPLVPIPFSKLVMDCIEIRPSRRPSSMNEVASRLALVAHSLRKARKENSH